MTTCILAAVVTVSRHHSLRHEYFTHRTKVPGHLYSYSFETSSEWSREYPSQEEIQKYLIRVAHKYQLYRHIRFNTSVEEATWEESTGRWRVKLNRHSSADPYSWSSSIIACDFLVSAVGQLSIPKHPGLKGVSSFKGKIMHSSRWDWDYDIMGKKVGIVGTGSTAAQIVPSIAPYCRSLVVFQRSPTWVMPRHDKPIGGLNRFLLRYLPFILRWKRAVYMRTRERYFSAGFDASHPSHVIVSDKARQHLQDQLAGHWNAELRCKLTPNYPFNCKRIVVSDDYYPALTRNNVVLENTPIDTVEEQVVSMKNGRKHDLDLLIFATGFETTRFVFPLKIYGHGGHSLEGAWTHGAKAYLGMTVKSLPNFAMLYGPNTNLTYNSLILQSESQSRYINTMIAAVLCEKRKGRSLSMQPRSDVVDAYNEEIQGKLQKSIFADTRCSSWFKTETGLITNNWSGSAIDYQKRTDHIDWTDFDFGGSAADRWRNKKRTKWSRVVEEGQPWRRVLAQLLALMLTATVATVWYSTWVGDVPSLALLSS